MMEGAGAIWGANKGIIEWGGGDSVGAGLLELITETFNGVEV